MEHDDTLFPGTDDAAPYAPVLRTKEVSAYAARRQTERMLGIGWVNAQAPDLLAAMTHKERLDVLRVIMPDVFEEKPATPTPAITDWETARRTAIEALLQTVPYPDDIATRDREIAQDFYGRWRDAYLAGELDTAILQAHLGDTGPFIRQVAVLAMHAIGLVPGLIDVHTREVPLAEFNGPLSEGGDFMGLAHVRSELDEESKMLQVHIWVNEDHPFLKTLHPDNETAFMELAGAVFHEVSHVGEKVAVLHREPGKPHDLLEDWMLAQRQMVGEYGSHYAIYRSLLSERQAYHRQHLFYALADNQRIVAEEAYCRGDKNAHFMSADRMRRTTDTFLELMGKNKPARDGSGAGAAHQHGGVPPGGAYRPSL